MLKSEFLAQPPLQATLGTETVPLAPHVTPRGLCLYKSKPVTLWIDSPSGKFRVTGTFTLTATRSLHWTPQ